MEFITETINKKPKVLIVTKKNLAFLTLLKAELKKYEAEIYFSSLMPKQFSHFDYCFFINESNRETIPYKNDQRLVFIFIKQPKQAKKLSLLSKNNVKIINLTGNAIYKEHLDKILWFVFSQSKERFLTLETLNLKSTLSLKKHYRFNLLQTPKRYWLLIILIIMIVTNLAFLPPLLYANYHCYWAIKALKAEDFSTTNKRLISAQQQLFWAQKLYSFVRPNYLFFSAAIIPDNILDLDQQAIRIMQKTITLHQEGVLFFNLLLKKNKNDLEQKEMEQLITAIDKNLQTVRLDLETLTQKIPSFLPFSNSAKTQIKQINIYLKQTAQFLPYLNNIFAKNTTKKYLLLFANNRELRPGGGFIGSFGIVIFKNLTLQDLQIYDVYDADGQLTAHIEPPRAIAQYLKQPHWFLRDSAFSPDFLENYAQAKFFLEKEMNLTNFSGAFLLTTNAIENILEAFGEVYLPTFQEKVNSRNFYLKAQTYAESNFFPGSLQKKSFLVALSRQLLLNLEQVSLKKLLMQSKKSLDEKQLVIYFDESALQEMIDSLYWSGRLIKPQCIVQTNNCIVDFLFPIDANLGVNKANYYIYRSINLKTTINQEGKINHILDLQFKNESQADVFPGGSYFNYFQVYLPQNSLLKRITKNDVLVEEYDEKNLDFKIIGFPVEVKPQQTVDLRLEYELTQTFTKGKGIYQLIVQKQIGSNNNDFGLSFNLAKNFYIINQNFSPLVKDNQIVYNTNLVADKIFISELIKE